MDSYYNGAGACMVLNGFAMYIPSPVGGQVTSWQNNGSERLCAIEKSGGWEHTLWTMNPYTRSPNVGTTNNDRANFVRAC